jgi:hypothetical protein
LLRSFIQLTIAVGCALHQQLVLSVIHQMTGLLRLSFGQTGNSGKNEPWQMASPLRQDRDVCSLLVENAVFAFIRA